MLKLFLLISCITFVIVESAIDTDIENKNVERTIKLESQLVKISYKITLEHKSKKNIPIYSFLLNDNEHDNLSYISGRDTTKKEMKFVETKSSNGYLYTFTLNAGNQQNPIIYIETVFTKLIQPYPNQITQNEKQLVKYFGNGYFYSPYKTLTQKTTVKLSSKSVEYYSQIKPTTQTDATINYGPYENIERKLYFFYRLI